MPTAAFLLHADGSLAYMNKAVERLARRQDGIRILRNRLVASDVSRQARLQALISFAAVASGGRICGTQWCSHSAPSVARTVTLCACFTPTPGQPATRLSGSRVGFDYRS
jgi:hypothetical protein